MCNELQGLTDADDPAIRAAFRATPEPDLNIRYTGQIDMSRICELTGTTRQVGHNVSHANNKTKRVFLPNLQNVTLLSESLEKGVKLRVSTKGLRSVEHVGGLDNWLVKTNDEKLSLKAQRLKREIVKKQKVAA